MALYDANIFLEGARQAAAQDRALVDTFRDISAGMQRRKELEEAALERKRKEALAEQVRREQVAREERAAAMQPEALLAKQIRGEQLSPEEASALRAYDVIRTSQRAIDPITGESYQKYASVSGGAPEMMAAGVSPTVGGRELMTAGQVEPAAGGYEMLRSMAGERQLSPVTGEELLPPPRLDGATEVYREEKMRQYAPQPRAEMPAGLNRRQQAEFQGLVMQKEFESSLSKKEKMEQAKQSLSILDDMIEANKKTLPTAYAGAMQPVTRLVSKDAAENMAILKQGRLRLAAPLAKQLGTNPTDKDFQATLDQIFNENEDRSTREKMLQEAKKFIAGDAGMSEFYENINKLSGNGQEAPRRKRYNPATGMLE